MRVILVRVGIDQSCGRWNGPCNPQSREFVYVPIWETGHANVRGLERRYADEIVPALRAFSTRNGCDVALPEHLRDKRMHLDPDFDSLTYGDTARRGRRLRDFTAGDVVMFYASLKPVSEPVSEPVSGAARGGRYVYALIGQLTVQEVVRAGDVEPGRFGENAHTRRAKPDPTDVIVRGRRSGSGRFARYVPVGEWRNHAYRVEKELLKLWGGLSAEDGYIQRSANPPLFLKPERFLDWLQRQKPRLVRANNPR